MRRKKTPNVVAHGMVTLRIGDDTTERAFTVMGDSIQDIDAWANTLASDLSRQIRLHSREKRFGVEVHLT